MSSLYPWVSFFLINTPWFFFLSKADLCRPMQPLSHTSSCCSSHSVLRNLLVRFTLTIIHLAFNAEFTPLFRRKWMIIQALNYKKRKPPPLAIPERKSLFVVPCHLMMEVITLLWKGTSETLTRCMKQKLPLWEQWRLSYRRDLPNQDLQQAMQLFFQGCATFINDLNRERYHPANVTQ